MLHAYLSLAGARSYPLRCAALLPAPLRCARPCLGLRRCGGVGLYSHSEANTPASGKLRKAPTSASEAFRIDTQYIFPWADSSFIYARERFYL